MFKKVFIDDIGKKLIDDKVYVCKNGDDIFKARFNYCSTEYWWTNVVTGKLTGISGYRE